MSILLQQKGREAQELVQTLPLPPSSYGQGMGVNLSHLDFEKIRQSLQQENGAENSRSTLVIDAEPGIQVLSLPQLTPSQFQQFFDSLIPLSEDKLTALHYSSLTQAKVIFIPKNYVAKKPIMISSSSSAYATTEHLILIAEEGSSCTIIETAESSETSIFKSQCVQIYTQTNAKVSYCSLNQLHPSTHLFSTKRAQIAQDSQVRWIDVLSGSSFSRVNLRSLLTHSGSSTTQLAAFIGSEKQVFDINAQAYHQSPHSSSAMYTKGVLMDAAKIIYRGTIKIHKNATAAIGHQRADTLLMGDNAHCDAVPILDVDNDDVTCSHGTTVGRIDEEQLFYLLSRGLDEESATKILLLAFIEPILSEIPSTHIQKMIGELSHKLRK